MSRIIFSIVLIGGVVIYTKPSFEGKFLYENLGVQIPKEYFEAFAYFDTKPESARTVMLPMPWYWGWNQTDWGTISSGFN